jgi:hypothetical protein
VRRAGVRQTRRHHPRAHRCDNASDRRFCTRVTAPSRASIDLYWLPLGAGGHSVRLNGRIYEAVTARLERRAPCELYHSALEVRVPKGRLVIEQTPIPDSNGEERGVVAEGAVGSRWAGRFRIFRYELRRWRDGVIPDVAEAVESPRRLSDDPEQARRLLSARAVRANARVGTR